MISMLKKSRLFYEKELLKTNQQGFRMEKVIKKKKYFICQMERI